MQDLADLALVVNDQEVPLLGHVSPRLGTAAGSLAERHDAHQHRAYARRFHRDEEHAGGGQSR